MRDGILHRSPERFIADVPGAGDVPGRKPTRLAGFAELVRPFITDGPVDDILSFIGICSIGKKSGTAVKPAGDGVIIGVLFRTLLEDLISVVGNFTHRILQAPSTEPRAVTVNLIDFCAAKQVDDVFVGEGL